MQRESVERRLVARWPLTGNAEDHSGNGLHGVLVGQGAIDGSFAGQGFVEVPSSRALDLGSEDFTVSAWVKPQGGNAGGGDFLAKWDSSRRVGFQIGIGESGGGYSSSGDNQSLMFGIDGGTAPSWRYCGRPNRTSNFVTSLTVFNGDLFVASTDAESPTEWAHVYRYVGGEEWEDCGRVGDLKTHGVGPLLVHRGHLYAATWNHDWTRVSTADLDSCHVYRYLGAHEWEDLGQPGNSRRLIAIGSMDNRILVVGDDGGLYASDGESQAWEHVASFPRYAHPLQVLNNRLYVGLSTPGRVQSFDGDTWHYHGNPLSSDEMSTQVHSLEIWQGRIHATTWPYGRVCRLEADDTSWTDCGRPGDSTEMNALAAYNGCLYTGTIPRAEVFRFDNVDQWVRVAVFGSPPGWEPSSALVPPVDPADFRRVREWSRLTSLSLFSGELYASVGSCTGALLDAPGDVRGSVHAMSTGAVASTDRPLTAGWTHIAATRRGSKIEVYENGDLVAQGQSNHTINLESHAALQIGKGPRAPFRGAIRDVRLYASGFDREAAARLAAEGLQ